MEEHLDAFGRELCVGDIVAAADTATDREWIHLMKRGKVVRFSDDRVGVAVVEIQETENKLALSMIAAGFARHGAVCHDLVKLASIGETKLSEDLSNLLSDF